MGNFKTFAMIMTAVFAAASIVWAEKYSSQTQTCLDCHASLHPGIVYQWEKSRHAQITPAESMKKFKLERRISTENVPENLSAHVVGCYECHGLNVDQHQDSFEHFDARINIVVTPNDCRTCHPVEVEQYTGSIKAEAHDILALNPVYTQLVETIISPKRLDKGRLMWDKSSSFTKRETCYGCHGTKIEVKGMKAIVAQDVELEVPDLSGWPNQGVGRINPDGSKGACTSCHPRHAFSLKDARKPYTCSQCHIEPDVPAYNVYHESKHGNIFFAHGADWNFDAVPWVVGRDFQTPTCTVCHNALITNPEGKVIAQRSHDFGARIWERIFGLIYSHSQPKQGATHLIKNKDGLPLPTTFDNVQAAAYLISDEEITNRKERMTQICTSCHATSYVNGHFQKFDNTIRETNDMVITATQMMDRIWQAGLANKENPFDEEIEMMWARSWLFYANSVRYASAMTGAPDYAAFKNGWWELTRELQSMKSWVDLRSSLKKK